MEIGYSKIIFTCSWFNRVRPTFLDSLGGFFSTRTHHDVSYERRSVTFCNYVSKWRRGRDITMDTSVSQDRWLTAPEPILRYLCGGGGSERKKEKYCFKLFWLHDGTSVKTREMSEAKFISGLWWGRWCGCSEWARLAAFQCSCAFHLVPIKMLPSPWAELQNASSETWYEISRPCQKVLIVWLRTKRFQNGFVL